MDFNDSFGNFNKENKKENISFEGNNNNNNENNNNISFEGCNNDNNNISFENKNKNNILEVDNNISFEENKNNISFDNMIIEDKNNNNNKEEKEEKKQNDIFNSLPMEIENQENQALLYYENLHINENLKHNINIIFSRIKKIISFYKIKFFYELKNRADFKYSKLVEAEVIFMNIQSKLNIFTYIERNFKHKALKESFINIQKYSKLMKYKEEQNKIKENEMKKKIKEVNELLKKNGNNLKDLTDGVDKLKNNEKNLNNEISEYNKKFSKLNEKYNNLIQKSKLLKDAIKKKMESYSLTLDKTIDPKISELQNLIKNKEKEKVNSMNYFEEFYKKMNDMLGFYESNYETLKSTINSSGTTNV